MDEQERFWEEVVALLLQGVCLIERLKLKRDVTTADLRKAGKAVICKGNLTNKPQ